MGLSSLSDDQNQQKDMADRFILCPVPPYLPLLQQCFPLQTCTYSKTSPDPSQIISMSRLQLQRSMPRDPWRANCSEVQPVLGTSLPCKDLSDLPNSPLPRISAHSGTLPRLDWGIHPPYFHHQAGSSSACPRHPVIRVCLDLQCQVRNSNHHSLL